MAVPGSRPDAQRTAAHLTLALVGYFVLVTAVITLSPFDFSPRRFNLHVRFVPSDLLANIALFLPLGFLGRGLAGSPARGGRVVLLAAVCSLLIETAQIFIRSRYVSPIDVLGNTCGAWLGVVLRDWLERWSRWHPRLVGRIGLDVPLVGLLYLLVPQLWLSSVGMIEDAHRSVTTLLLGGAGSLVLVALHRHRWGTGLRLLRGAPAPDEQRFESSTLRRFLPVFALYLTLTSLWPPVRAVETWHGAWGFANRLNGAAVVDVLILLEQVGGFTLLGYAMAEWRGRRELTLAADLPRVVACALVLSSLLELAQGVLSGPGASALRALLSTVGTAYGAAVYHLARAHVRALRAADAAAVSEAA
jgi:VanZ family protein